MSEMQTTEYTPMQTLIRLAAAGARGETVNDLCVDWKEVFPFVAEQHVQSLVACALLHSPELECPEELREYLLNAMRSESSGNLIRRQRIMHLLTEMHAADIDAKVLKGYAVAGCYVHPECRGSVDTDLLIDISKEKQAVCFLQEHDFRVDPRAATSQHAVCQHKKYGMLELHVALYAELIQEIWFQGIDVSELTKEPSISVSELDGSFTTLGHTDQLIFLTLHMIKHFILEGLTLRMMLDIALYFSCNRDRIDHVRFWDTVERMHYAKLVNGILWIMISYGDFEVADFPGLNKAVPEHLQMILNDLKTGGYMGNKEQAERFESGMEYNHQLMRKQKSALQYTLYMVEWKIKSGLAYMFPTAKTLQKLYPITQKYPVLMPALWVWQACSFPFKKILSGALKRDVRSDDSNMTAITKKRLEIFRALDMI